MISNEAKTVYPSVRVIPHWVYCVLEMSERGRGHDKLWINDIVTSCLKSAYGGWCSVNSPSSLLWSLLMWETPVSCCMQTGCVLCGNTVKERHLASSFLSSPLSSFFCCTLPCSPCYVWLYNYMIQKVQKGNKEERKKLSLMDNFCCVRPGIWIHDCGIKLEPANQIESLDNRYSPLVSNQYVISSYSDSPPFSSCLACYRAKCIFYCNIIIANVHILVVVSHLLIFIQFP